ncbi:MAG TPA: GLUG motif-containing protein, partial [Thermotogota bacterium]|nr:GLUG motif-containing protein [Thermotogota bacterium]
NHVYVTGTVTGHDCVGGLLGRLYEGNISNSYTTVEVIGYETAGLGTPDFPDSLGGLCGRADFSTISIAYSTGTVTGYESLGGLCGFIELSTISDAYTTGKVSGTISVGGFVGRLRGGEISGVYSAGLAEGNDKVGGFIGDLTDGTVSQSFWDTQTSGQSVGVGLGSSTGITGKTTSDMKKKTTFTDAGWDFNTVWDIETQAEDGAVSYPFLQGGLQTPAPGHQLP